MAESLRPLLEIAEQEAAELFASLGGFAAVSAQRRLLLEDVVALGIALRGQLAVYLRTQDPDAAARVGTLASARRSALTTLGLERLEKEVPDLTTYLREKAAEKSTESAQSSANGTEDTEDDSEAVDAKQAASARPGDGVLGSDSPSASAAVSTSTDTRNGSTPEPLED